MLLKDSLEGLDKLLFADIPEGSVILVTGAEGTLKSGLVFSMMSGYIASCGAHGLYITLEQNKESHIRNMESLGINRPAGLHIFDFRDMRQEWTDSELDLFRIVEEVLQSYRERYDDLKLFALDSLNAIYSLTDHGSLRSNVYRFFSRLSDEGLTSFLIMESSSCGQAAPCHKTEHFLADGIIDLGMIEGAGGVKRYIQIMKMRAAKHAMEKHQIAVGDGGISVRGPLY